MTNGKPGPMFHQLEDKLGLQNILATAQDLWNQMNSSILNVLG